MRCIICRGNIDLNGDFLEWMYCSTHEYLKDKNNLLSPYNYNLRNRDE